jgi:predicted DNA-binding transcriptional regulator YafY
VSPSTTRVLAVLELLQARGQLSSVELAARLEISRRTVRRYITALQDLGIPVQGECGPYGGYRLRPGFKLPPLMFTHDEALAVVMGLLAVRRLGLGVAAYDVERALAKIERVLPAAVRDHVEAAGETLTLDFTVRPSPVEAETVMTLRQAAEQHRRVWLRYRAWNRGVTERAVDPYGLVYRGHRWFMVGWCHMRGGLRTFRLDRVLAAEPRAETFTRPADFDPLTYLTSALGEAPATWALEVVIHLPLAEVQRQIVPVLVTLEETPDGVVLRGATSDLRYWAYLLAGLDCPLTIRQPPELHDALLQLGHDLIARVDRPTTSSS